ncbi:hypothetical protein A9Q99_01410 [Gammaproteobacteria bacterium 45_16_T64]|nr:hypothetical protein A9Q99_01410 [Gammaproteobacteria bacterium 45_16_T64]
MNIKKITIALGLVFSIPVNAAVHQLEEGDCQAQGLALNSTTGKLEMDVTECAVAGSIWFLEVDGINKAGYFAPETRAAYWAAHLPHSEGHDAYWEIRGQQPDARFHSFQSYDSNGNTKDFVFDADLTPTSGSVNWVKNKIHYPGAHSTEYSLPIYEVGSNDDIPDATDQEHTALYLTRDSATELPQNTIVQRVYFNLNRNNAIQPEGMSDFDWIKRGQVDTARIFYVVKDVKKPHFKTVEAVWNHIDNETQMAKIAKLTQALGDASKSILDSISITSRIWQNPTEWQMNDLPASTYSRMWTRGEEPILAFFWHKLLNLLPKTSAFPNEVTRYFVGGVNPSFGDVHVTRMKMPRTLDPDNGDIIDSDQYDLRFFSICTHLSLTLYTIDCLVDSDLEVDPDGYVTFVMSDTEAAPIDPTTGEPAANWVNYPSPSTLVLIRHMMPSESFTESLLYYGLKCREEGDCADAAQDIAAIENWTGEYYPTSTYCSVNNFEYNRCSWKFNLLQEWLFTRYRHWFDRFFGTVGA